MAIHHLTRAQCASLFLPAAFAVFPMASLEGRPEFGANRILGLGNGPGVVNHPVNVTPSAAVSIPPDWPVAVDGAITCTTCHSSLTGFDGRDGAALRGESTTSLDSKSFCMNCHREDGPRTAAGTHWLAVSKAHIIKDDDGDWNAARDGAIDFASRTCLSCHDGVNALDAGYETTPSRYRGFLGDKGRNHPIGVRYPRSGTRRVDVPLRPASLLPGSISLPGGLVTCNSCHNLYGTNPNRLSVPIEGSKLCLTCHVMD